MSQIAHDNCPSVYTRQHFLTDKHLSNNKFYVLFKK